MRFSVVGLEIGANLEALLAGCYKGNLLFHFEAGCFGLRDVVRHFGHFRANNDELSIFASMRQVLLNVEEKKLQFFLELVKSLDFVEVNNSEGDSKEAIIQNIKQGLEEVKLAKQGKLKTTPAKEFLNEL